MEVTLSNTLVTETHSITAAFGIISQTSSYQKSFEPEEYEFTPEEPEPIAIQDNPVEAHSSPLDEIRQLANELASVGSIEQN